MRSTFFWLCALAGLAICSTTNAAERPNLVIFITDDLGVLDISPYGGEDAPTPNIARLAADGVLFRQAFVASPSCAPSRAALLTGLMPARNGAEANHSRPRVEIKKLPAYLKELGYEVASFGKVAHYNHGPEYGFDHVAGEGFHNHAGIPAAVEYMKSRQRDKPLCVFIGTNWPHVPWPETDKFDPAKLHVPPSHVDTSETRAWRARYYAAVKMADDDLGTIRQAVQQYLEPQNTYTFFTSDHGSQFPFGKWNLYDAGIRTPLIVSGPGIQGGKTTDAQVSWIDLLPTLVDLAGGAAPTDIDGRSFAPVLRSEKTTHREEIYTTHSGDGRFNVYPIRSLRTPEWKYILNLHPEYQHATHVNRAAAADRPSYFQSWETAAKNDPQAAQIVGRYKQRPREELYDLVADPYELHNLAADPQQAERLAAMRTKLEAWLKEQNDQLTVFSEPLLLGQEATPVQQAPAKNKNKNKNKQTQKQNQ